MSSMVLKHIGIPDEKERRKERRSGREGKGGEDKKGELSGGGRKEGDVKGRGGKGILRRGREIR